ncbi:MAG: hypothetical protein JWP48_3493 [Actinoallomurus sp.]|nr:hypothetical protein [Actinoallomurus sp.]
MIRRAWVDRNSLQVGPLRCGAGSIPAFFKFSHTVEYAMRWPSRASSPWMRRCPHPGFCRAIATTNRVTDTGVGGRPGVGERG